MSTIHGRTIQGVMRMAPEMPLAEPPDPQLRVILTGIDLPFMVVFRIVCAVGLAIALGNLIMVGLKGLLQLLMLAFG